MLYDCDTLIHVICNHPEDSSRYYTFGIKLSDINDDSEIRKEIKNRVNPYGYWHEVIIWIEYYINKELYKHYIK